MCRNTRAIALLLVASFVCLIDAASDGACAAETLRVMTFNIWRGGEAGKQPLDQTIQVIREARADLVGIQESHGEERDGKRPDAARVIARSLDWHHFDQGDEDNAVISRYPIVAHTPKKMGAAIELFSGKRVWLFNVHLAHAPYQPYQLLKIPYADAPFLDSADQAVRAARKARRRQAGALLHEIESVRTHNTPVFITGDFNEPSALDWTDAVWRAGGCPAAVPWPTTAGIQAAGFIDAYRTVRVDPLEAPGYTWTPTTSEDDPADRHDRIDFVFVGGASVRVERAEVVGERSERADIVVAPYPSDHRAVVATVVIE